MKKFFIFLLVLAMVPMFALAEELDPIVGSWYMYFDANVTPEIAPLFPNFKSVIAIYAFQPDGTIMLTENDVRSATDNDLLYNPGGKWSKTDGQYSCSIIGAGEGNCFIEDGDLYISIQEGTMYMKFHKLIPFNPYKDYLLNQ